jgi:3-(3-hydroxy-phenyl)propionate hydroxylase
MWSDDALGNELTLIGCGVDPARLLDAQTLSAWQRVGGRCLFLRARQQNLAVLPQIQSRVLEDETGGYAGQLVGNGTVLIVRPDRVVLGLADRADAVRLVTAAIRLLS